MKTKVLLLLCLLALTALLCTARDLKVFIIAHSHIDPGWLRTVDEYRSDVHAILAKVMQELQAGAHRKFIWAETIYFKGWYEAQTKEMQKIVRHFVNTGRLEFVGGGWVQNDEACPTYTAIIDQMTVGHEYLLERFGVRPKIAWQIDPFGHDSRVPQLYAEMGFDALVINRVHHKIKQMMKNSKSLEFLWNVDGHANHSLFTNVLHTHYSAPQGFDFENPGVEHVHDGNVHSRAQQFVSMLNQRAEHYKTDHILIPFGDDFKFREAGTQFNNMDKLIDYISKKMSGVKIRYATLSDYFDSLFKQHSKEKFPVVRHDFHPYADNEDSYWTGYYTSLPNLKKRAREAEAALNAAEASFAFARLQEGEFKNVNVQKLNWVSTFSTIQRAREDSGVVQHHDAITGTCRTHVYHDYLAKLNNALSNSKAVERQMISVILSKPNTALGSTAIMDVSEDPLKHGVEYGLLIHNPTSHRRSQVMRFNMETSALSITSPDGKKVEYQAFPITELKRLTNQQQYEIMFEAVVDGLSYAKYVVKGSSSNDLPESSKFQSYSSKNFPSEVAIENSHYRITIDTNTGYIARIKDKATGASHEFKQQYLAYITQRSGSYIFRPSGAPQNIPNQLENIFVSKGPVSQQVISKTKQLTLTVRLFNSKSLGSFIELAHQIAPIPGDNEIVTRIPINGGNNKGLFITYDGLNFLNRVISDKSPHAGKFYPSPAGAIYRFPSSQLVVLTDHTMAVTATNNELEFMIHRRLMRDDGRGMSQANADDSSLSFSMFVSYQPVTEKEPWVDIHRMSHAINNPITMFSTDKHNFFRSSYKPLESGMNENLQIISFKPKDYASDDVILRIHNLNPTHSVKINNMNVLTDSFVVDEVRETSLSVMYDIPMGSSIHKLRRSTKAGEAQKFSFTEDIVKSSSGSSQNTDEEGVFLSDAALNAQKPGRKLLQISKPVEFGANGIRTFIFTIRRSEELEQYLTPGKPTVLALKQGATITETTPTEDKKETEENKVETDTNAETDTDANTDANTDTNTDTNTETNTGEEITEDKENKETGTGEQIDENTTDTDDNNKLQTGTETEVEPIDKPEPVTKPVTKPVEKKLPVKNGRKREYETIDEEYERFKQTSSVDLDEEDSSENYMWDNFTFMILLCTFGVTILFCFFVQRFRKGKSQIQIQNSVLPLTLTADYFDGQKEM